MKSIIRLFAFACVALCTYVAAGPVEDFGTLETGEIGRGDQGRLNGLIDLGTTGEVDLADGLAGEEAGILGRVHEG